MRRFAYGNNAIKKEKYMQYGIENEKGTLMSLMQTVKDQAARVRDFTVPTDQMVMLTSDESSNDSQSNVTQIVLEKQGGEPTRHFAVNDVALDQIAQKANLDVRTARRVQQNYPRQFDSLVNAIWQKEPSVRMLRTFDSPTAPNHGIVRAVVSNSYKTFDNIHLLNSALPQLIESPAQWEVVTAAVTDKRLYLRLKSNAITGQAAVGDVMANGIMLSNSEVGMGSVSVAQLVWTLACLNGMQSEKRSRHSHVTSARSEGKTWGMLTDEAKSADNHALSLKVRDLVTNYADRDNFDATLERMREAHTDTIEGTPAVAAAALGKVLDINKKENILLLDGLMSTLGQSGYENGKPISRATLVNAVTRVANNVAADEVDDWQKRGGRVLDLPKSEWQRVALAA
jgi:hypothetical protein